VGIGRTDADGEAHLLSECEAARAVSGGVEQLRREERREDVVELFPGGISRPERGDPQPTTRHQRAWILAEADECGLACRAAG